MTQCALTQYFQPTPQPKTPTISIPVFFTKKRKLSDTNIVYVKPSEKPMKLERAKSGRSKCRCCRGTIAKNEVRLGVLVFSPYKNYQWYHVTKDCVADVVAGQLFEELVDGELYPETLDSLKSIAVERHCVPIVSGNLSMQMVADVLTTRYSKFRSFTFGTEIDTPLWESRVFFATILVCNTKEQAMLEFSSKFFEKYPTVQDVAAIDDVDTTWRWMAEYKIQHAKRKVQTLIDAAKLIIREGEVPDDQRKLESVSGVGRHVSSVTLAWTKQAPEYGVDVHVSRIMKRLGLVPEKANDKDIEAIAKAQIRPEQLGHFSRSFVDHGQSICSYSPDCGGCFLRSVCPMAQNKDFEW
jgi:endonuclease III